MENEFDKKSNRKRRRKARGGGKLRPFVRQALSQHPGDPHRQISFILREASIPAAFGRERPVSDKTLSDYRDELHRAILILKKVRAGIQNIDTLGRKHVIALCRHWENEGLEEKTIHKYVSTLRRFLELMGKFGAVPVGFDWREILRANGVTAGTGSCSLLPEFPKGWRHQGVDPVPLIDAIRAEEPVVGAQLDMQLHFALRANESTQIIPEDSDKGDHIIVWRGTKGGKERVVMFSADPATAATQRAVLERAKELARLHPKRCLGIPGFTLREMKNRMLYVVRKHGVHRKGLGITMHGLRHQFACDLFTQVSGLPAPILGRVAGAEYEENAELVRLALTQVARQLGHERAPIACAYVGSAKVQSGRSARLLKDWLCQLSARATSFRAAGIAEAWIVGHCTQGVRPRVDSAMRIAVRYTDQVSGSEEDDYLRAFAIDAHLSLELFTSLGFNVCIEPWRSSGRPLDGVEILI
ncbi:tyrosine-type recombinase/integrase [Caenimonas sedimenti]|uniref:Tyrosine-type recombinase/integrase n=1 Tax=Caenimonas sedimenti TaxID=2596921 RepID=A0A562ZPE3_9BURK|nr:site-specific integrase [Caenimonas sedimenti]TWO70034.1 tyrosine-type recombinase/integrase [Caenimonas sedimenti]